MSAASNTGSNVNKPPGSMTMQGNSSNTTLPPPPPVVIGTGAPVAPPMDQAFANPDGVRAHLLAYIGAGPNYGQLTPVPSGFLTFTDKNSGNVVQKVFYRRQTLGEKGTKKFWVMWIWPGCQVYELHVHYNISGKVAHINLTKEHFGASTNIPDSQYAAVKKGGIDNPPEDSV